MKRTGKQNNAAHLYARRLATALRDVGDGDMRTLIEVPIWPTQENVWALIVKPVMRSLYPDKKSTTELSTGEMAELASSLERAIAIRFGIDIPWPSEEEMRQEFLAKHGKPDFICRR